MAKDKFKAKPGDELQVFTWDLGSLTINARYLETCSPTKYRQIMNLIKRAQTAPVFRRARR